MDTHRARRLRALIPDVAVAVAVGAFALAGTRFAAMAPWSETTIDWLGYLLVGIAAAALALRRRWPAAALAVAVTACAAYLARPYPHGPIYLTLAIAMFSLTVRSPARRSLTAAALSMAALFVGHLPELRGLSGTELLGSFPQMLAWATGWLLLPWTAGTLVRVGREDARRKREEDARRLAYEERLRVAREIHDVVGHGLAVINMQAGVALHVLGKRGDADRGPDEVQAALAAIKGASKAALDELRGTLAVFRRPDDGAPRRPMPGLDQLDTLVAEMTGNGLPVDLAVSGDRASLPGGVDLAAYRIVQESLTNVLRHAGPATATVRVSYGPGEVAVEVLDDGRGPRPDAGAHAGHGLVGMRERAVALGGTFDAGPRPGGGFRVHAILPVEAASR